jgi:hypothetical protein
VRRGAARAVRQVTANACRRSPMHEPAFAQPTALPRPACRTGSANLLCACTAPPAAVHAPTRRSVLRAMALAAASLLPGVAALPGRASAATALERVVAARAALDAVDGKISNAQWDGVRTVRMFLCLPWLRRVDPSSCASPC